MFLDPLPDGAPGALPPSRAALMSVRRNGQGWRLPRALRGSGISTTASIRLLYFRLSITHYRPHVAVGVIVGDGPHFSRGL